MTESSTRPSDLTQLRVRNRILRFECQKFVDNSRRAAPTCNALDDLRELGCRKPSGRPIQDDVSGGGHRSFETGGRVRVLGIEIETSLRTNTRTTRMRDLESVETVRRLILRRVTVRPNSGERFCGATAGGHGLTHRDGCWIGEHFQSFLVVPTLLVGLVPLVS